MVHNRARSGASTEITVSSTNAKTAQLRLAVEKRLAEADPALGRVIAAVVARIGPQRIAPSRASPFEALVRAVTYQSVSGKAAAAIFTRLSEAITRPLTPSKVVAIPPRTLVKTGLSRAKAKTIGELARWFMSNRKLAKNLRALPDNEVVEHLTAIAGIGAWTVNVLLIFNLGRRDVMPAADHGNSPRRSIDGRTARHRDAKTGDRTIAGLGAPPQHRIDLSLAGDQAGAWAE